ncbi:MAG: PAS domain S-box protein [bacterium]
MAFRTAARFIHLVLGIIIFFGAGLVIFYRVEKRRFREIFFAQERALNSIFDQLVELKGSSLNNFVYDYTYWDEMVRSIKSRNKKFFDENIAEALATYGAHAGWVYNRDGKLVYSVQAEGKEGLSGFSLTKKANEMLNGTELFCHFWAETPLGFIEVRGATVHPSDDPERKTQPQGVFFAARLWDDSYVNSLGGFVNSTVALVPFGKDREKTDEGKCLIVIQRPLPGIDGQPVAELKLSYVCKVISQFRQTTRFQMAQLILIAIVTILAIGGGVVFWVTKPLKELTLALSSKDARRLVPLSRSRTEFGELGRVIARYFAQEAELRREKERAQMYLNVAQVIIVVLDKTGKVTLINQQGCAVLGYEEVEILGKNWFENFLPASVRSETYSAFERLMQGGIEHWSEYENPVLTRSGEERLIHWHNVVLRDESGAIVGTLSSGEDITERRKAEMELQEREAMLGAVTSTVRDGIVMIDDEGRVVFWNQAAEEIFGYKAEEILGKVLHEIIAPERYLPIYREKFPHFACTGEGAGIGKTRELEAVHRNGHEVPVELSLAALWYKGRWHGVGVLREITERKRAERALQEKAEELRRSNQELERFAYVASHDLQEPLRMVGSYIGLLARRYQGKLDGDADEFINFAVDGVRRMQGLINDLLTYSRVGTRGKEPVPTDSNAVFSRVLLNLKVAIEEKMAVVTSASLPVVRADERQLEQLLQNLVGNALKFTKESPRVEVWAERVDGMWRFAVKDNGIGIDPKHSEKVFEIFQRLHTREEYPGTGIGLAVCKKIVERHGGKIWFESEVGRGTTFFFTLPPVEDDTESKT